jgi:hypothetical protein
MNPRCSLRLLIFALILMNINQVLAQTESRGNTGFLSIVEDNDNYAPARHDRHYTHGLRIGYGFQTDARPVWVGWLGELTPLADGQKDREYEIAMGQNLYTPEYFSSPLPQPDDRPYAGWLYAELSVTTHRPGIEEMLAVNLGVVGPAALGEQAQKLIHELTNDSEPAGWRHQLGNEPALLLRYRRSWFKSLIQSGNYNMDLVAGFRAGLGNVLTAAGAGVTLRIGSYLPEHDLSFKGLSGIADSSPGFDARPDKFDWFIYTGLQGRLVGHNIFLDGNSDGDSLSVDRKLFVWDATAGLALTPGYYTTPIFLTFNIVWSGREFRQQLDNDSYGSLTIVVRY